MTHSSTSSSTRKSHRSSTKFESSRRFLAKLASRRLKRRIAALSLLLLGGSLTFSTLHADDTWTGGGSSANWSDSGNWNNGTPATAPYGTLYFSTSTNSPSYDDIASVAENKLLMNTTGAFTINGTGAISLYDYSGTQAKIENNSGSTSGLFTLNTATINFAATSGAAYGEINAVTGDILFGTNNTLNINGSAVSGIKMYGAGHNTTFNNTVNASGKYFGMTATGDIMTVGGTFNSADIYVMNGGTLNLAAGGVINNDTNTGVRLGGDFGTTGNQNQALSGTFNLTSTTGSTTFAGVINSVSGNTSGTLAVNSQNTSGTNTLSGHIALDSNLSINESGAAGTGVLNVTNIYGGSTTSGTDIKAQTLTLNATSAGNSINYSGTIYNSTGSGSVAITGAGTVTLSGANTYAGTTTVGAGTTLNVNSATALGTGTVNLSGANLVLNNTSGAAITLTNNNAVTLGGTPIFFGGSNSLSFGTGTASISGDHVVTLNGNNTNTLAFGTLQNTATGGFTLTVNNATGVTGETLVFNGGFNMQAAAGTNAVTDILTGTGNIAINGPVANGGSGANILAFNGTGMLTLGGVNTYTGATQINGAGTLRLTGTLGSGGGTAITANNSSSAFTETSTGVIAGSSSLTIGGATVTLAGANTYTGTTQFNSGNLYLNSAGALGSGIVTLNGGTLDNTSGAAITGQTNNPAYNLTNALSFGGSNSLNMGTGTLSNNGDRTINLNGNNANTLTFALLQNTATTAGFALNVANGTGASGETLVLGGFNLEAAAGTGGITDILKGTGNLTITGAIANGSATANNLTYTGTGLLTLAGVNTYTGSTALQSGTTVLTGTLGSGGGTSITLSGGTFTESATGAITGVSALTTSGTVVTLAGANTYTGATAVNSGTVSLTGSLTGSSVTLAGGNFNESTTGSIAGTNSTLTDLSIGTVTLAGANTYTGTTSVGNGTNAVTLNLTGSITGSNISVGGPTAGFIEAATGVIGGTSSTFSISSGSATLGGNNTYTGLTTDSGGTLTISGNESSASGGVTLSNGKLNVNSATALGTGTFTLSGGTLDNTSGAAITGTLPTPIALGNNTILFSTASGTTANSLNLGTGPITTASAGTTFTLNGAGALTFGGTLTNTLASAETLTVNGGSSTAATTALNLGGWVLEGNGTTARTDVANGSGTLNITGPITDGTGTGSGLTYNGTGTLTLGGSSSYTGATTLTSGSLGLTGSTNGSNFSVTGGTMTESTAGVIAGTANTFTITGGTATLSGQNTYAGNTYLSGGTLNIGGDSTLTSGTLTSGPLGTGILALNNATIAAVGAAHTINNPVAPNNDNAGFVAGSQNLTFAGNFNLGLIQNHYTTLTVNNTALTTFSGGINMAGQNLTFKGTGNILVNSAITGSAQYINSSDTSTLTLSGTNTYTGGTIGISAGTLLVTGSIASTGTVTIGNSSTATTGVTLGGNGSIAGAVTFTSTGAGTTILSPGPTAAIGSVGTLTTGALTMASTTTSMFDVDGLTNYDKVSLATGKTVTYAGTLVVDLGSYTPATGTSYQLFSATSNSGAFTDDSSVTFDQAGYTGTFTPTTGLLTITSGLTAVPEPTTWLGGLLALGTLGYSQRRTVRRWLGVRRAV